MKIPGPEPSKKLSASDMTILTKPEVRVRSDQQSKIITAQQSLLNSQQSIIDDLKARLAASEGSQRVDEGMELGTPEVGSNVTITTTPVPSVPSGDPPSSSRPNVLKAPTLNVGSSQ